MTEEQKRIFNQLKEKLESANPKPALLHGVTGSGKTEIYLKLVEENIKNKRQTIILVPEIMLTPQLVRRFEEYFPNQVCLMHSHLSKSERFNSYEQFFQGEKQIIIGPRSALLVPSNNLGLIIIDEEQEDAYKQEKAPRYNAVKLAEKIATGSKALLLLGSATPDAEIYYMAMNKKYDLLELKNRYHKMILPPAEVVDLRQEIKSGNYSPISEKLKLELKQTLTHKKQAILFINRRGAATFVSCRDCGHVILCPRCSIPLVYHIHTREQFLSCHHCDYKTTIPKVCPGCNGARIKYFGSGIEKIEIEIKKLFPKAKVRMVDSRSMEKKGAYHTLYDDLKNQKIDILIGTQIVAKGLDLPEVDLVGVVSADTGLHLPHYRANEKVFQILTQVSGRSGRKNNCGKTIIQTYWPESRAIRHAAVHDYDSFYDSDIIDRKKHNYPPFSHMVRIISEDNNIDKAKKPLLAIAQQLKTNNIDHIGPAPCFYSRLNNKYRYHILVKSKDWPSQTIYDIFKTSPYLTWDVGPTNLL